MAKAKDYKDFDSLGLPLTPSGDESADGTERTPTTPQEAANATWSGGRLSDAERGLLKAGRRERLEQLDIYAVFPDRTQPRRAIPSAIRATWNGKTESIFDLLRMWWGAAEEEHGDRLDMMGILKGTANGDESDKPPVTGPIEDAFLTLVRLAASIRRDGLTNPVTTVRASDGTYRLETGERRWLAYHLLHGFFPQEDWSQIPARLVESFDVWRQATENTARADLNAIGKARQFAILLMDAHGSQNFQPFNAFLREKDYYAQVADGNRYPIPRGKGDQLAQAMGLKSAGQLRDYRRLLSRLPHESWTLADDFSVTEFRLRQVLADATTEAEINQLVRQAAAEYGTEKSRTVSTETLNRPTRKARRDDDTGFKSFTTHGKEVNRYLTGKRKINRRNLAAVMRQLDAMEEWIDQAREMLSRAADAD